jgi:hypothetical protein
MPQCLKDSGTSPSRVMEQLVVHILSESIQYTSDSPFLSIIMAPCQW